MSKQKTIAFDLDDTLWPCKPVIQQAEQRFYDWLAAHYPRITAAYSPQELIRNRISFMQEHPHLHYNLTHLRKNWMATLAEQHRYPADLVEPGLEVFWLARNEVTLFDDALETLQSLAERFITGVISNGNASVQHIGIGHLFRFAHNSEAAGVAKPHPDIFHQALAQVDVEPHHAVYVGDDPVRDIKGAADAGLKTIWYNPANTDWPAEQKIMPDATITRLAELDEVLTSL